MTVQTRRQATKANGHKQRWLRMAATITIAVLLVIFGAQLAHGPSTNKNNAGGSTNVTAESKPTATVVASVSTPVPALQPAPPVARAPSSPTTPPPASATISRGASAMATTAFARFEKQNGKVLDLGSSTSAPFTSAKSGVTGQYFANAVLEYHPEFAGTPYAVELARVGVALADANHLQRSAPFKPLPAGTHGDANCWFVQATRHRLCNGFRSYWRSEGLDLGTPGISYRESLALFGYPISEEFTDPASGLTVQYFERGVLSYDRSKAPADRVRDQTSTEAVLERWHFQIIAGVQAFPSGG